MAEQEPTLLLKPKRVKQAVKHLSKGGRFRFTFRNLYYKLIRTGDWPQPQQEPVTTLERFKNALQDYEDQHGPIPGRIRNVDRLSEVNLATLPPDVADYTTRRVLVFDRQEVFLSFVFNGFFRKLEIGLLLWPDYPSLVSSTIHEHLAAGAKTSLYLLHDCNRAGYDLREQIKDAFHEYGNKAHIVDLGLRFRQASNLGIPIRADVAREDTADLDPLQFGDSGERQEARLMLRSGCFAHLEELPPLRMLRWTYSRIATRTQDIGYG